ncbi:MAG TPA: hypothetical protein P5121_23705 [Caldilineaceae bacterium]|nr:hypothetical protein [Caldilineaceae bacterium]
MDVCCTRTRKLFHQFTPKRSAPKRTLQGALAFVLTLALLSPASALWAQEDTAAAGDATAAAAKQELLVFEVNRKVTTKDRGFPRNDPPRAAANGNWKSPINYAEGTFFYRVEIRKQPQPKTMRIQFCIWQDRFRLENCGSQKSLVGKPGTVVTWSQPVQGLWKKGGKIIDWSRPRQRYGIAIKNSRGKPVSNYNGWNWNGENPNQWYPLDMHVTVVVVPKGASFSGWQNYGGNVSDNALITASTEGDEGPIFSDNGNDLEFGSGMDFDLWERESATDDPTIEDEALDNKLYLPIISS